MARGKKPTDWLAYCLGKPGAWRDEPWEGDLVVKVGSKIFAFLGSERPTSVGLKCGDREAADLWLDRYPDHVTRSPYIGAHGWNVFRLDGDIPEDEVGELIDLSYELIVAKLPRRERP
jgi:predicted DNA-binding protein (MmcQ/YjbR family)